MHKRGFTLIELLVVIAIVALLSSIIFPALQKARQNARDTQRKQDLVQLRLALENYFADNGFYPWENGYDTSLGSGSTLPSGSGWATTSGIYLGLVPRYIKELPVDPINTQAGNYFYNYEPSTLQGNCPTANYACEIVLQARLESGQWFCVGPATANLSGC